MIIIYSIDFSFFFSMVPSVPIYSAQILCILNFLHPPPLCSFLVWTHFQLLFNLLLDSDTRDGPWRAFWRSGYEVHRPYAHALAYVVKENKFREHLKTIISEFWFFQGSNWLSPNIWLSSLSLIATPVFADYIALPNTNQIEANSVTLVDASP